MTGPTTEAMPKIPAKTPCSRARWEDDGAHGEAPARDGDQEAPPPADGGGQQPADDRPDDRGNAEDPGKDPLQSRALGWRVEVRDGGENAREENAAEHSLKRTE